MYVVDIERLLNRTEHTKTNERTKTKKNNKRLLQVFSFLPKIWNNIGIVYPQPTNQPNNLQDIYPCPMSQDDDHHHHHRQNIHPIQIHTSCIYLIFFPFWIYSNLSFCLLLLLFDVNVLECFCQCEISCLLCFSPPKYYVFCLCVCMCVWVIEENWNWKNTFFSSSYSFQM